MVGYTLYYIYIYICCSRCNRIVVRSVFLRLPLDYRYDYTNTSITSISSARRMSLRENPQCDVGYTRKLSSSCSLLVGAHHHHCHQWKQTLLTGAVVCGCVSFVVTFSYNGAISYSWRYLHFESETNHPSAFLLLMMMDFDSTIVVVVDT